MLIDLTGDKADRIERSAVGDQSGVVKFRGLSLNIKPAAAIADKGNWSCMQGWLNFEWPPVFIPAARGLLLVGAMTLERAHARSGLTRIRLGHKSL